MLALGMKHNKVGSVLTHLSTFTLDSFGSPAKPTQLSLSLGWVDLKGSSWQGNLLGTSNRLSSTLNACTYCILDPLILL